MRSQNKAIEPKLTCNINGSISFSFYMYTKYIDNISGEETSNPYTELIKNETKLKLYYENEWYDLLVKKIDEDSANSKKTYSAISQHVNELSKNGFNVELTDDLGNNTEDICSLARRILEDTDWEVDEEHSDIAVETRVENLIPLRVEKTFDAIKIDDSELVNNKGLAWHSGPTTIEAGQLIFAFYSSCTTKPHLF
jgi:hypothetical protein